MSILSKKCIKCGKWKDKSEFSKNSHQKDGHLNTCKECAKGIFKVWRDNNHEHELSRYREYRENNKQKRSEGFKQWRQRNLDRIREYARGFYKENPDKKLEKTRNRRAKLRGSEGSFTSQEWRALKEFHNFACLRCRKTEPNILLTPDHILPLVKGGKNSIDNIQPLCRSCNSWKKDKHIDYREGK